MIESENGLYVAVLTSLLDREATDAEKERIIEERKTEQYDSLIEKWREETEITFSEEMLQGMDFAYEGIAIPRNDDESKEDSDTQADEKQDDAEESEDEDAKSGEDDAEPEE